MLHEAHDNEDVVEVLRKPHKVNCVLVVCRSEQMLMQAIEDTFDPMRILALTDHHIWDSEKPSCDYLYFHPDFPETILQRLKLSCYLTKGRLGGKIVLIYERRNRAIGFKERLGTLACQYPIIGHPRVQRR